MKKHVLATILAIGGGVAALADIDAAIAGTACVQNSTNNTLFVILSSSSGKAERTFRIGDKICQSAADGDPMSVNILPYGGARFGCKADLEEDKTMVLLNFSTMNKCEFLVEE